MNRFNFTTDLKYREWVLKCFAIRFFQLVLNIMSTLPLNLDNFLLATEILETTATGGESNRGVYPRGEFLKSETTDFRGVSTGWKGTIPLFAIGCFKTETDEDRIELEGVLTSGEDGIDAFVNDR